MTEAAPQALDGYEFSPDEEHDFNALATRLTLLAAGLFAVGVVLVAYLALGYVDTAPLVELEERNAALVGAVDYGVWGLIAALVVLEGWLALRLVDPVRQITASAGSDVKHLMEFVRRLTWMVQLGAGGAVAICALLLVSLGLSMAI